MAMWRLEVQDLALPWIPFLELIWTEIFYRFHAIASITVFII